LNLLPRPLAAAIFGAGWKYRPAANVDYAQIFKATVGLPVIGNGGFERRDHMEAALNDGKCDMIAVARALLANPDLLNQFRNGVNEPARPCTHCNRCSVGTGVLPVGCFDRTRFDSQSEMEAQVYWWSGGPVEGETTAPAWA